MQHFHCFSNCELAFETAEKLLGVPRLLDVEDVILHPIPDRLSIMTYVSQFYHKLANLDSDSGIFSLNQSPTSSDSEIENFPINTGNSRQQKGAVLSLLEGRRRRSTSCNFRRREGREKVRMPSPPVQSENPFRLDVQAYANDKVKESSVQTTRKKENKPKKENEANSNRSRKVKSLFLESFTDLPVVKPITQSTSVLTITATPKPYENVEMKKPITILSKTQTYLQEKRKRSQSQPPEKNVRQKLEFLSTSNYERPRKITPSKNFVLEDKRNELCNHEENTKFRERNAGRFQPIKQFDIKGKPVRAQGSEEVKQHLVTSLNYGVQVRDRQIVRPYLQTLV